MRLLTMPEHVILMAALAIYLEHLDDEGARACEAGESLVPVAEAINQTRDLYELISNANAVTVHEPTH